VAELPSENFLLHFAGKGDAIAMCVFENRDQDVKCTLAGTGDARRFTGSEIDFGKDKKVWVALLEAPQIWHVGEVKAGDSKKESKLDWTMPWLAQWRVDFTRADDLTDSWDLLLQKEEGGNYIKPSWMGAGAETIGTARKRWTTVLNSFKYPCWSDARRSAYLQPLETEALTMRGPVVIYPANRVPETPPEAFTVLDIARNALGAGPCEYILDLDNQRSSNKGADPCRPQRRELRSIGPPGASPGKGGRSFHRPPVPCGRPRSPAPGLRRTVRVRSTAPAAGGSPRWTERTT
jgi:hypothetical protein